MSIRKFMAEVTTIVAALGFATALVSAPAQAADDTANPYTPEGLCGSGYYRVSSHPLTGARVHLMYNGAYNCVVTIKSSSVGTPTQTSAALMVDDGGGGVDTGQFSYYAGPVKAYGRDRCIKYGGYHGGTTWYSAWGYCG